MRESPVAIVTGGAGFIGSHLVDLLLERGFFVRVIDDFTGGHRRNLDHVTASDRLEIHERDIRELQPGGREFADAKLVFHLAGIGDIVPSIERPSDYMSVNVQGTVKVLECARHSKVEKFLYAASSSCYGLAETPTDESHPITPLYPYALSKYLGEEVCLHWFSVYGLPVNVIRIFNAYGPRVRTTGAYGAVFGVFLRQKLAGQPFTVVGDGSQARDFVYVTDVARAFLAAAESSKIGRTYNLGANNPQSINRLVSLLGGEVVYIPDRPGEPKQTWADTTRIQEELGWAPKVGFEEGVSHMLDKIEDWRDAPLWEPKSIEAATKTWFDFMSE